jgi:hypothetical protein
VLDHKPGAGGARRIVVQHLFLVERVLRIREPGWLSFG